MAYTRALQVLSALLGAGFKEDFQRRVRIQSYDQKVGQMAHHVLSMAATKGLDTPAHRGRAPR